MCEPVRFCDDNYIVISFLLGKEVPESAVLQMKANFVLPDEHESYVDNITWIELTKSQAQPLINRSVQAYSLCRILTMVCRKTVSRPSYIYIS